MLQIEYFFNISFNVKLSFKNAPLSFNIQIRIPEIKKVFIRYLLKELSNVCCI
jgi:hypothetical protein